MAGYVAVSYRYGRRYEDEFASQDEAIEYLLAGEYAGRLSMAGVRDATGSIAVTEEALAEMYKGFVPRTAG